MNMDGIIAIPSIAVICYLIALIPKAVPGVDNKWIPIICGVTGGILGVAGMFIMPDYPAKDYFTAIAMGIVSGLGATGANQIFKQISGR